MQNELNNSVGFFILSDSYDIVTVVGSHIANHIESEALIEIIRLVRSGESNN